MDNDTDAKPARRPQRRGWTWTLIKCGIAMVLSAIVGTIALMVLLHALLTKLPGWLPSSWARWLFEWVLHHVWFVGPLVGLVLGSLVSVAIVIVDAKRGRLTRVT